MLLAKLIKPWVAALLAVEVAVEARAAYELAALTAACVVRLLTKLA